MRRITLLTDFGTADGYVGAMKGVIAMITPSAVVDDISHDVPPGDVAAAAWALHNYALRHPVDSVHVIVVDPGVGTPRRALAGRIADRFVVAPDNGVLTYLLRDPVTGAARPAWQLHEISNGTWMGDVVSATFHGRDIFAPAAAHIAGGAPLEQCGAPVDQPVLLRVTPAAHNGRTLHGVIIHVDRFGNLITNIPGAWLSPDGARDIRVRAGEQEDVVLPLRETYGDVADGGLVVLTGSAGTLEISRRNGSAADTGWGRGDAVVVEVAA